MFMETQNWQDDGTAEELGWTLLKERKDGKAAIAVKKRNSNLLRYCRRSTRWILVVLGGIFFVSRYLPHTWCGEANLEGYFKMLKDLDRNMQEVKGLWHYCRNGAQVEVKPRQGAFVGDGTRMSRGNTMRYHEMESKFETLLMEWIWIKKHEIKLANTFCRSWEPTRARTNRIDFWMRREQQLQKWKIIDYIAVPISWVTRSTVARKCRAQNLTDHWPVMTYVRLPHKKEGWRYQNNSILKGWRPKTESDESGFGRMIVRSLEDAQDLMGGISIEDITKTLRKAARAIEFESTGGGHKLAKKTREQEKPCKRCRRSRTNKLSVMHCILKKKEKPQMTDNNGRRSWKDTRGRSIRMRK